MSAAAALRARFAQAPGAVGLWLTIPSPVAAEVVAAAGADYVVIDQQHGAVEPLQMLTLLQATAVGGAPALVRVASNDPWVIGSALDLGAAGVIVPMVDTPEEAARAVAACRYAPDGVRSFGALRGAPEPRPLCLVMVETRGGLDAVDAIASTPDLDGVYVGPSDLALSLGLQPTLRIEHAPVLDGVERVRAGCERAGIVAGVHCLLGEDVPRFARNGFGLVTAGSDLLLLRDALGRALASAREAS